MDLNAAWLSCYISFSIYSSVLKCPSLLQPPLSTDLYFLLHTKNWSNQNNFHYTPTNSHVVCLPTCSSSWRIYAPYWTKSSTCMLDFTHYHLVKAITQHYPLFLPHYQFVSLNWSFLSHTNILLFLLSLKNCLSFFLSFFNPPSLSAISHFFASL